MDEEILAQIAKIVRQGLVDEIKKSYPVKSYNGQQKTIGGQAVPNQSKNASGNFIEELNVFWDSDFDSGKPVLVVEMSSYGYYILNGRKPSIGRYPPLERIREWTKVKPLPRFRDKKGRYISNNRRAFLVSRSIMQHGWQGIAQGRDFFGDFETTIVPKISDDLGNAAAAYFEQAIKEGKILTGL